MGMKADDGYVQAFSKIYCMLEDDISKDIYLNRLNYLITGDMKYMRYVVDTYLPHLSAMNGMTVQDLLAALPEDRKIILYGAGRDAEQVLKYFTQDQRFVGFCDRDENKQQQGFHGCKVISPQQLASDMQYSVIISSSRKNLEIKNYLRSINYPETAIIELMPYIPCVDENQYFNVDFLEFGEEIFVDDGCNVLESTVDLMNKCSKLKKVYAFEPDAENYKKSLVNKEKYGLGQVELFPYGTWSGKTQLSFAANHNVGSHVCEDGNAKIDVVAIDDVVNQGEVTFIKMDIEGSELEALKGAAATIRKWKPKLAISIYHKPEDMVELPLYIKELVPEYKLYLRHHSNNETDTVLYAKL